MISRKGHKLLGEVASLLHLTKSTKEHKNIRSSYALLILHNGEVTRALSYSYEMPITRVWSNVIGVARLCARYVKTASELKLKGTDETKNKAPLWKPVEARKIGLKSAQPQMI